MVCRGLRGGWLAGYLAAIHPVGHSIYPTCRVVHRRITTGYREVGLGGGVRDNQWSGVLPSQRRGPGREGAQVGFDCWSLEGQLQQPCGALPRLKGLAGLLGSAKTAQ